MYRKILVSSDFSLQHNTDTILMLRACQLNRALHYPNVMVVKSHEIMEVQTPEFTTGHWDGTGPHFGAPKLQPTFSNILTYPRKYAIEKKVKTSELIRGILLMIILNLVVGPNGLRPVQTMKMTKPFHLPQYPT